FTVPVVWSETGYDAFAESQTVAGILDYSMIPELEGDTSVSAVIHLAMNEVSAPGINDLTQQVLPYLFQNSRKVLRAAACFIQVRLLREKLIVPAWPRR
ncbi:MAG: hypothetical protein K2O18_06350, partial [Oscillospiraceae bacterium]|nr:hypothetical protein [Oscillospiraceae bacterium]